MCECMHIQYTIHIHLDFKACANLGKFSIQNKPGLCVYVKGKQIHGFWSYLGKPTEEEISRADNVADQKKALKQILWPDMDLDGLPSGYCVKVIQCLGKWQAKITALRATLSTFVRHNDTESSEAKFLNSYVVILLWVLMLLWPLLCMRVKVMRASINTSHACMCKGVYVDLYVNWL